MGDMERLDAYEKMHRNLQAEYLDACAKLEELRAQEKAKTVTFKTLIAKKMNLREWLDVYERYGLNL